MPIYKGGLAAILKVIRYRLRGVVVLLKYYWRYTLVLLPLCERVPTLYFGTTEPIL